MNTCLIKDTETAHGLLPCNKPMAGTIHIRMPRHWDVGSGTIWPESEMDVPVCQTHLDLIDPGTSLSVAYGAVPLD